MQARSAGQPLWPTQSGVIPATETDRVFAGIPVLADDFDILEIPGSLWPFCLLADCDATGDFRVAVSGNEISNFLGSCKRGELLSVLFDIAGGRAFLRELGILTKTAERVRIECTLVTRSNALRPVRAWVCPLLGKNGGVTRLFLTIDMGISVPRPTNPARISTCPIDS